MSFHPLVYDMKNLSSKTHDASKFDFQNNLFYFEGYLYIVKKEVHLHVLQAYHDLSTSLHFGYNKTLELISRDFWWLQM